MTTICFSVIIAEVRGFDRRPARDFEVAHHLDRSVRGLRASSSACGTISRPLITSHAARRTWAELRESAVPLQIHPVFSNHASHSLMLDLSSHVNRPKHAPISALANQIIQAH